MIALRRVPAVWWGSVIAALLLFVAAPALLSPFDLGLLARFLCISLVAVGIGLAWGQGGMLTLGQGVFFGLGAYMMAMHLKIADATSAGHDVPDFMMISGVRELPALWEPFRSPAFTIAAIVVVPTLLAVLLGVGVFKRRVRGAYFAILSQALAAALATLLVGQQILGGSNGLNNFAGFFGYRLADPANREMLYFIVAGTVLVAVLVVRQLMRSRYGELLVAVRDQEERVRFLGYDPATVKVTAYAFAALLASIAGALYVPVVGIISPADVGVVPSIVFLVGVAIGGRATLLGPVLGALAIGWASSVLSDAFPSTWTYAQGLMFIVVVGFFPAGLAGVARFSASRRRLRKESPPPTDDARVPSVAIPVGGPQ